MILVWNVFRTSMRCMYICSHPFVSPGSSLPQRHLWPASSASCSHRSRRNVRFHMLFSWFMINVSSVYDQEMSGNYNYWIRNLIIIHLRNVHVVGLMPTLKAWRLSCFPRRKLADTSLNRGCLGQSSPYLICFDVKQWQPRPWGDAKKTILMANCKTVLIDSRDLCGCDAAVSY